MKRFKLRYQHQRALFYDGLWVLYKHEDGTMGWENVPEGLNRYCNLPFNMSSKHVLIDADRVSCAIKVYQVCEVKGDPDAHWLPHEPVEWLMPEEDPRLDWENSYWGKYYDLSWNFRKRFLNSLLPYGIIAAHEVTP